MITKDIDDYGTVRYYNEQGQLHREDGPARVYADGTKAWWINGLRHKEDGPAVEYADGTKYWYLNGKRHREDGPAVEWSDGTKVWYLNDKRYSEQDYNNYLLRKRLQRILEL